MIKNNVRDYAVSAFDFYVKMGRPDSKAFMRRVYDYAERKFSENEFLSDTQRLINTQNLYNELKPAIDDICTVNEFLEKITHRAGGAFIKQAVETVYFTDTSKNFEKGDYTRLVHKAELAIPASEATVYRYLAAARNMFAAMRGLRSDETLPPDFS